ncbi:MAG: ATP-binding protein [Cyanobacteria bacterium J06598_3]
MAQDMTRENSEQHNGRSHPKLAMSASTMAEAIAPIKTWLSQHSNESAESLRPLEAGPSTARLNRLCDRFHLSPNERQLLLLCAGMEIDPDWPALCASANNNSSLAYPTFRLAQQMLPTLGSDEIAPASPLRDWTMISRSRGLTTMTSMLQIDEHILHYLLGSDRIDGRLSSIVHPVAPHTADLPKSQQAIVNNSLAAWKNNVRIFQFFGQGQTLKRAIAAQLCQRLQRPLYELSVAALPTDQADFQRTIRLWQRETTLHNYVLLINWNLSESNTIESTRLSTFMSALESPVVVISAERTELPGGTLYAAETTFPTRSEQRTLWHQALTAHTPEPTDIVDTLVGQFSLDALSIQNAAVSAAATTKTTISNKATTSKTTGSTNLTDTLWQACRIQARPRLDSICQRIETKETWEDLILPDEQKQVLQMIIAHNQQRNTVYEDWGFAGKSSRGLGTSALFAGPSGTGKTMAANVIAQKLNLDLYKVDLSTVVSKYIGETEKNLKIIFDAAESGGVILLFDEADSIFGKRSEVNDSRDRYANMEVSYLLQRMESYRGLAILTTNMQDSIDAAFVRRIRFITRFPFPEYDQRYEIWQRVFPSGVPKQGLDYRKLARLGAAGGNIRSIALSAAFLAAAEGAAEGKPAAVTMERIYRAAKNEYRKMQQPMPTAATKGWLD